MGFNWFPGVVNPDNIADGGEGNDGYNNGNDGDDGREDDGVGNGRMSVAKLCCIVVVFV